MATAVGCSGGEAPRAAAAPRAVPRDSLRVGVLHSGAGQPATIPAVALALDEYNATRAAGARPLAVVVPRGGESRSVTLGRWQDDPAVIGIVSSDASEPTLLAAGIIRSVTAAGRAPTPYLIASAGARHVTGLSPWIFRVAPRVEPIARLQLGFVRDSLRGRRIAIAYTADVFGREALHAALGVADSIGLRIVTTVAYNAELHDLPLIAARLRAVAPDAVVLFSGDAVLSARLLRTLRTTGMTAPAVLAPALAALASWGDEFAGEVYIADADAAAIDTPFGRALVARMSPESVLGPTPFVSGYGTRAYDAARLLTGAVGRVGADRARIRAVVATGSPTRVAVATTPDLRFDAANDARVTLRAFRIPARGRP